MTHDAHLLRQDHCMIQNGYFWTSTQSGESQQFHLENDAGYPPWKIEHLPRHKTLILAFLQSTKN